MNIPKEIIEKAIEEGWQPSYVRQYWNYSTPQTGTQQWELFGIALDPIFWQCLGKSLGWFKEWTTRVGRLNISIRYAHRFYDLILQGKPTEEFWKQLLANK